MTTHVLAPKAGGPYCGADDGNVDHASKVTCRDCLTLVGATMSVLVGGCEHWPPEQGMCGSCGEARIRAQIT